MTLSQFVDYVRRRHNATSDNNWSDAEIYQMITARSNEICSIIGGIEGTDTATTTVASTQAYNIPSGTVTIKALLYDGELLQRISFRDWELQKAGGTTPTGKPERYVIWNNQVLLIPTPSAVATLTFYIEKMQGYIDDGADTIDIPEEMHFRLADGVLSDMFAKDLNGNMARMYEEKWLQVHIPAFYRWKARKRRRGRFELTTDSDSAPSTDTGVV